MFVLYGRAYISGLVWGISKKVTERLNRDMFTPDEHKEAEHLVGRLHSCKPIQSVFSEEAIERIKELVETDTDRQYIKLLRDEYDKSDKPWCITAVFTAIQCFSKCMPSILYETTMAYIYDEL